MPKTFRVITYELKEDVFSTSNYDLILNHNLSLNYFTIIIGGSGSNSSSSENHVRVVADPFGTGSLGTSSGPKVLSLARNTSSSNWIGSITVVECLGGFETSGFKLVDVVEGVMSSSDTTTSVALSSSWTDIGQVIPFGGIRGGGVKSTSYANSGDNPSCHGGFTIQSSPSPQVTWSRDLTGSVGVGAEATIYIVEWGAEWNIQHVTVNGSAGGNGASSTSAYDTATINAVTRENTFLWASGYTSDGGIGDSFSGTLVTLGDGVSQNTTETTVAVGQEYSDTRTVEVYVAEHHGLAVDHIFKNDGNRNELEIITTTDPRLGDELYPGVNEDVLGTAILAMPSMDGIDGGWPVLYGTESIGPSGLTVCIDEDTLGDTERGHTSEEVAYLVFIKSAGYDIENSSGQIIGEHGIVSNVGSVGTHVNFRNTYVDPIVVVTGTLQSGDLPAIPRAYNISSTSFTVRHDSANPSGTTPTRDVCYVVLESGSHNLFGNVPCEAGRIPNFSTLNSHVNWSSNETVRIFPLNSYSKPCVFGGVQTSNDDRFQAFWANGGNNITSPSSSAIYLGRHIGADLVTTRANEDMGYIIWESGSGLTPTGEKSWFADYTIDEVVGVDNETFYIPITSYEGLNYTSGYRFGLQYNGCNGTGVAFPRPYFGLRHINATSLKAFRSFNGQDYPAWQQSIDFFNLEYEEPSLRRIAVCS